MPQLELLEFQTEAVEKLIASALAYYEDPDKASGRIVPFVGQLKAVTGAGKTPILTRVVGRLSPAIILWTTKFGSVVDQTVTNLRPGGKYHHLFQNNAVEVIRFSDIPSSTAWNRILERQDGLTILVSTVAAWNQKDPDNDPRLNVHKVHPDWGTKSRWDRLKLERSRPLWVVYDEAHNTTTEQVELLDDLDPAGFLVATASPVKGKLQQYLTFFTTPEQRQQRIIPVRTLDVVNAQLLKSTISLADYDSSPEEMLGDVVNRRSALQTKFEAKGNSLVPKAIYVVETSNTVKGVESRPAFIWRTLVNSCGISPNSIAVCTNTKDLPKDAIQVSTIDELSDSFTHIIFNKRLQEGWDDPSVYVCYFDGKTDSATRIQQVLGRAMRQPGAAHLSDEDLNTAFFFVNCPSELLDNITEELKEELRIYKDEDAPDGFEPFQIKEERKALPKIALKDEFAEKLKVPKLQLELDQPSAERLRKLIERRTFDFGTDDLASPGKAVINVVSVRTGDVAQHSRDLYEDMRVRCGTYLQEQIRLLSRNCANSIKTSVFSSRGLDKRACYKSKAIEHYHQLAIDIVREYENHVKLDTHADPNDCEYIVGAYQPSGSTQREFQHAGHPCYDGKSFKDDELEMAKALDKHSAYVWVRNKDRIDYGIPLPVKSGSSSAFYPDFLWWVNDVVWAIDPTGKFILDEKLRFKLLEVPKPLKIALVTRRKYDSSLKLIADTGWTLSYRRMGTSQTETFDTLGEILETLIRES